MYFMFRIIYFYFLICEPLFLDILPFYIPYSSIPQAKCMSVQNTDKCQIQKENLLRFDITKAAAISQAAASLIAFMMQNKMNAIMIK